MSNRSPENSFAAPQARGLNATASPVHASRKVIGGSHASTNSRFMLRYQGQRVGAAGSKNSLGKLGQPLQTISHVSQSCVVKKLGFSGHARSNTQSHYAGIPPLPLRYSDVKVKGKFVTHKRQSRGNIANRQTTDDLTTMDPRSTGEGQARPQSKHTSGGPHWTPDLSTPNYSISLTAHARNSQPTDLATILDHDTMKFAINTSQRLDHFKRIKEQLKQQQAKSINEEQEDAQHEDGGVVFTQGQSSSTNFTPFSRSNVLSFQLAPEYGTTMSQERQDVAKKDRKIISAGTSAGRKHQGVRSKKLASVVKSANNRVQPPRRNLARSTNEPLK